MTAKGMGKLPHIRHRRDRVLAVLREAKNPMTTNEVAKAVGARYGTVYQDLRALCGSATLPRYAGPGERVNQPGYPVVWHTWETVRGVVLWELSPAARTAARVEIAALEAALALDVPGGA